MIKDIFDVMTYITYFMLGLSAVVLILAIIRDTKFLKRLSNYKHIRIGNTKDLVLDILGDKRYSVNLLRDGTEKYTWGYGGYTLNGVYNYRYSVSVYFKDDLVIEVTSHNIQKVSMDIFEELVKLHEADQGFTDELI